MNTVITGASKGIGKAIALKFASQGHNLALCARNVSDLDLLKKEINTKYPNIKVFVKSVDISKSNELRAFGADVITEFGEVDALINNGGVFLSGNVLEEEEGVLAAQIETNLYSAYHLSREIVPVMIRKGSGHVFNMCSIASQIAYPNGGSYTISKFALLGFSKVLREELKDKGIKVTSILPGATWSASWSGVDLPHERLMEAEDIADTVWAAYALGPSAVVEEIVIRPQLGDL
ncbi:MAG TPA: SDR family oxidoreductase [Saprospiraceae bacterium]|nr:SDR family oxidoreductase [Saprospiraceae bacterium]